ncbi:hypothetical protein BCEN4_480088 [Burkholderia cenocepacia]|nr:hypothetical protein BCEN4_480088 [Burkholderia cenocepacia]
MRARHYALNIPLIYKDIFLDRRQCDTCSVVVTLGCYVTSREGTGPTEQAYTSASGHEKSPPDGGLFNGAGNAGISGADSRATP